MKVKKITIIVKQGNHQGQECTNFDLQVQATDKSESIKGTEVLKVLNEAMTMVLDEMLGQ